MSNLRLSTFLEIRLRHYSFEEARWPSALDSGSRGLGSNPDQGHCAVFLGKPLLSHSASLSTQLYKWLPANLMLCLVRALKLRMPERSLSVNLYYVQTLSSFRFVNALVYFGINLNVGNLAGDMYLNFFILCIVEIPGALILWFFMSRYD